VGEIESEYGTFKCSTSHAITYIYITEEEWEVGSGKRKEDKRKSASGNCFQAPAELVIFGHVSKGECINYVKLPTQISPSVLPSLLFPLYISSP